MKLKCPVCAHPFVSRIRKVILGPFFAVRCEECGNLIGTARFACLLCVVPAIATAFGAWSVYHSPIKSKFSFLLQLTQDPMVWAVCGFIAGLLLFTIPLALYWLPLKIRRFAMNR